MLLKATDSYRGNPTGIAAMTEQAIKAIGVKPDRSEVLAVTAKILAYRKANHGKGKHKGMFQNEEMNQAVRDCLHVEKYADLRYRRGNKAAAAGTPERESEMGECRWTQWQIREQGGAQQRAKHAASSAGTSGKPPAIC
jgi:hypothetical protein